MIESVGHLEQFFIVAIGTVIAIIGVIAYDYPYKNRPVIKKYRKKIGVFFIIVGIVVMFYAGFFAPNVGKGEIGIDQNGNWYNEGPHMVMPFSITFVPLKGSIAYSDNLELQYDLTREEVMLLSRGSHFPEYLQEEIWIVYGENVTLRNVPAGIDPSHLKVMIGFNPPFFI